MALLPRTLRRDWGAMVVWLRCPLLACHPGAVGGRSWAECEIDGVLTRTRPPGGTICVRGIPPGAAGRLVPSLPGE